MAEPKRPMDGLEASFGKTTHILARSQTEQSRCSKHEVKQVLQG
ncbi:hypothetical protein DET61_112119 [Marinobacter nauticus]|jgi:hypothetical protein|uniref:Uncharacterized protein n=1 Tax=Marinobacter nauticus TaxID=2743 RepID=A0A368XC72_MARNT|nr:hypothetical protein DET61_112119 [Marinobacter nauticus]